MPIPDFDLLAREFPDYWKFPDPAEVRKMLGGGVNDKDITNTCTIRLSHAMNAVGATIPRIWQTITNRKGKNGQYYIIRVVNFHPWMEFQFGKPDLDFHKESGKAFDRKRIRGYEGVIGFHPERRARARPSANPFEWIFECPDDPIPTGHQPSGLYPGTNFGSQGLLIFLKIMIAPDTLAD
jgi:Type VI secretion system (T6SS), amidase effector protein 4